MTNVSLIDHICYGCEGCIIVCPKNAITPSISYDGFIYPKVNSDSCISCQKCLSVCPGFNEPLRQEPFYVGAYANIDDIRLQSSSGGFFSAVTDNILDSNGFVVGSIYDYDFKVKHVIAKDSSLRNAMRTSKYVQSRIGSTYHNVEELLNSGELVLFSGTPCQIHGLHLYLDEKKASKNNLITCDFICHGVSSPLVWNDYLKYIKQKYKEDLKSINFRDKRYGWHKPNLAITFQTTQYNGTEANDPYFQMFYSNCILRESCHVCNYSQLGRVSDITMADCWGIERINKSLDDDKGLSLVLINTEKGYNYLKKANLVLTSLPSDILDQPHLKHPALKSPKRDKFWQDYHNKPFNYILNKYGNKSIYRKLIKKMKRLLLRVIKR